MLEIILFTGLLLLVQLTLPSTLGLMTGATSLNYLAGARDEPMANMPVSVGRAKRAAKARRSEAAWEQWPFPPAAVPQQLVNRP